MATLPETLDWTLLRAFLAVADTGSLSGAARLLQTSQPTVGRQVQALELALETSLFRRKPKGMELTEAGAELIAPARAMQIAARDIVRKVGGAGRAMSGTVRITASVFMAHHVLPEIFADIRRSLPNVALELVPSDEAENLLFREADIAVRMYRPEQLDVITRHLGDVELGLFGTEAYLARIGPVETDEVLERYEFVGYDRGERLIRGFRDAGVNVTREFFPVRCDSQTTYWELVRAGCGLGFASKFVASRDPLMREVDLGVPIPTLPVWLTAHQAMRRTPRVARVFDLLAQALVPILSRPETAAVS
ncbi:MAG: LysR family transcriptional regulator [Pseudomonadota bacterium]